MPHPHHHDAVPGPVSRRTVLGGLAAAPVLAWAGAATAATAAATPAGFAGAADVTPLVAPHPSALHTAADLALAADRVAAGAQPWTSGWDRLVANGRSASSWTPRPLQTVIRGGDGQNYAQLYPDIHAAYQNALRWRISGSTAHRDTAVRILNAWSSTLRTVTGNADRFLAAGIYGYQFANAAELVRDVSGFDRARFQDMLLNVFYPLNDNFLVNHNDAVITNYWANWDLCTMCSVLAIGIFAGRDDLINRAIDYFESGAGNGSIRHAVPFVYNDQGLAQWQESGRDQGHTVLGIGLMAAFCEMAWHQGVDCYGYDNNRFLKACEYVAKYNLGNSVPFTTYTWQSGPRTSPTTNTQTAISSASRGQARPIWETVIGHYEGRQGLSAPWSRQIAESVRPDGGGGDYGSASGGYDQLGFTTLLNAPAGGGGSTGYVRLRNVGTGLYLDGMGRTTNGDAAGQYGGSASANQRWVRVQSGSYLRFRNQATGLYLDGMGRTTNGDAAGQWADSSSTAQQWQADGSRLRNRATGLYLDGAGRTTNGADVGQWASSTSANQQWEIA